MRMNRLARAADFLIFNALMELGVADDFAGRDFLGITAPPSHAARPADAPRWPMQMPLATIFTQYFSILLLLAMAPAAPTMPRAQLPSLLGQTTTISNAALAETMPSNMAQVHAMREDFAPVFPSGDIFVSAHTAFCAPLSSPAATMIMSRHTRHFQLGMAARFIGDTQFR